MQSIRFIGNNNLGTKKVEESSGIRQPEVKPTGPESNQDKAVIGNIQAKLQLETFFLLIFLC